MVIKIVTTFNKDLWEKYVHKIFVKSVENWGKLAKWEVWVDEFFDELPQLEGVTYRLLADDKQRAEFIEWAKDKGQPQDYRFDLVKFCHKVFAISNAEFEGEWMLFLGADVETHTPVDDSFFELLKESLVHLGRKDINYSETDFLAFRNDGAAHAFLRDWRGLYTSKEIINHAQWTDAYVFERLLMIHKAHGLGAFNLSEGLPGLNVFEATPLGKWMRHYKGPAGKQELIMGQQLNRLKLIQELVDFYRPGKTYGVSIDAVLMDGPSFAFITTEEEFAKAKNYDVIIVDGLLLKNGVTQDCVAQRILKADGRKFMVLPSDDKDGKGNVIHMVAIVRDGLDQPRVRVPLRVTPKDCVEKEWLYENIAENLKLIPTWLERTQVHGLEANIVSGGPNFERDGVEALKANMKNPNRIFCVKHSLPMLLRQGIKPYACVVLDPRELEGVSTHGFVRKELFGNLPKDVYYFVASMTHPSVTKFMLEQGVKIVGWHAYSQAAAKYALPKDSFWITGGTCSALRTLMLAHTLGFRTMNMYGFDLCIPEPPVEVRGDVDNEGRPKYLQVTIGKNKRDFWTTGELVAAMQDVDLIFNQYSHQDYELNIYGDGAALEIWNQKERKRKKKLFEAYP